MSDIMQNAKKKYKIETFGCQMNVHDSEKLAGTLVKLGYEPAKETNDADIIVFNTCCIRDTAEKRIVGNIGALKSIKKKNPDLIIAVVGCMTQQEGMAENLISKFPFVDIVAGTVELHELGNRINELIAAREAGKKRKAIIATVNADRPEIIENEELYRTSFPNAWVNIMYGCNNFCTYCVVPYVRGRERSREPEAVIAEITSLLAEGYKEITLLGQNVNSYGNDRNDGWNFEKLLRTAAALPGRFRIRFMTSHPKDLTDGVINAIASEPNICNNIHLPVQSGSNKVLKDMNRRYTRENYIDLIKKIREAMPDCGISSDIMVGFPTETEEDFRFTLELAREVKFSNAFTFIYSPRKGTKAAELEQIPYAVKKSRIGELIALQNEISRKLSDSYVGKYCEVLVEGAVSEGILCGRTESGRLVDFAGDKSRIGEFVTVKIIKRRASSLIGSVEDV